MTPMAARPVNAADRLLTIDALRGLALLGILLMNILTFALPEAAYMNPHFGGGDTLASRWAIVLQYVLAEGKMRGLFSMMFGASAVLLISRGEIRGAGLDIADVYYRRTLWLMLFGIVHAFLIWWGDILYPYALMGLILFPLRKLSPKALLVTGGLMLALLTGAMAGQGYDLLESKKKAEELQAREKQGEKLTGEQKKTLEGWNERLESLKPPPDKLKKEIEETRGGYLQNLKRRAKNVMRFHAMPFYSPIFWDFLAMMLVGMAFLKLGILTGERSFRFYAWLAAVPAAAGTACNVFAAWSMWRHDFDPLQGAYDQATYEIGRPLLSIAYAAVLVMIVKAGALRWLTRRLAAVGQMAFSNYITHSIVCSLIFYGYGFGMFNRLERYQLYGVVLAIWTAQLIISPLWLRRFQFGPLEWCWRSLTYWQRQPMRHHAGEPEVSEVSTAHDPAFAAEQEAAGQGAAEPAASAGLASKAGNTALE